MSNLKLRDASECDAPIISGLIYATEDDSAEHVWGQGSKEEILKRIEWLVKSRNSRYSYLNIKVAELDGKACGAIILINSEEIDKLDLITSFKILSLVKGFRKKLMFIKDIIDGFNVDESGENELYIANVATLPEVRGKGVGKELMKLAEKTAKKSGYKSCSLLAKDENIRKFYEKLDYVFEEEQKYFSHSLYKMVKAV